MIVSFDVTDRTSYDLFLKIKRLPRYRIMGRVAEFPDEYASLIGLTPTTTTTAAYSPLPTLYDYQRDISALAISKQKYAVFAEPGSGKTLIDFEYVLAARDATGGRVLIVAPLMVVRQMIGEAARFYGERLPLEQIPAAGLQAWLNGTGPAVGITNYEAIREGLRQGNLSALVLSESSMLKSHYGKWGRRLIDLGKGLAWKLCETGTPAPNDRIEYANHAVFLDQFPTVNAFLARYFVNRGQTDNRWEIKPHAMRPFYRDLSHWCIFLTDPSVYGWVGTGKPLPPIHVHIHEVPMTTGQRDAAMTLTKGLFSEAGGFVQRGKLARLAKGIAPTGTAKIATRKPLFIKRLIDSWPDESTLLWCNYNREQKDLERIFPDAASIAGETPVETRMELLADFHARKRAVMMSKSKILGFGLNLQVATRMVFSSLVDSYESYFQCVKRANRIGSDRDLNVHIPVTEIEQPMVANVLAKAGRVESDTREQEQLFREARRAV